MKAVSMVKKLAYGIVFCLGVTGLCLGLQGRGEAAAPFKIGVIDGFTGSYAISPAEVMVGVEAAEGY